MDLDIGGGFVARVGGGGDVGRGFAVGRDRVAERHAVAVGELPAFRGRKRRRRPRMTTASRESASLPRRRRPARRCRTAAACPARAKCSRREDAGDHAERAVIAAGIDHGVDMRADQQALRCPCPSSRPRTVPSASSRHREPGLAHPCGDQIGGAAMLGREKQADQPLRLGRDRAERVDHRLGARAECVNLGWGKRCSHRGAYHGRCGPCQRSARRSSRASQLLGFLEAVHAGVPLQRDHRALDRLDQQQRRAQASAAANSHGMDPVGRLIAISTWRMSGTTRWPTITITR